MQILHYVDLPYACFGIVSADGIVTEAAPIGRWMIGKPIPYNWVCSKGGTIQEVRRYNTKIEVE